MFLTRKELHFDFEEAVIGAVEEVFHGIQIRRRYFPFQKVRYLKIVKTKQFSTLQNTKDKAEIWSYNLSVNPDSETKVFCV